MLARQGHAVTLLEQTPRVGPVGAGVLLQASGQRVLASLGLLDAAVAGAERIDELVAFTHRGRPLSRLAFADGPAGPGGPCAFGVHRGDLFSVLHAAVVDAGVDLRLHRTVAGLATDGRTLLTATGDAAGPFDLVVAADGSRSRLRRATGQAAVVHPYGPAALWAVGRDDAIRGRLVQYARGTGRLCGLLPMGGGRASFFWGVHAADWPALRASPFDAWRDAVVRLASPAGPLVGRLTGWDDLTFSTYRAVWMPDVTAGRVAFIGDAAHASSPLLGHGINLAMLDARDLAASLAEADSVDLALARYDRRQRWRNLWYAGLSAALTPSFQGRSRAVGFARDRVLPRLQRVGPVRRLMLRTLAGV